MMLIAFDIVENKGKSVAGGKIADRAFQGQSVDRAGQGEVWSAEAPARASFSSGFHGFIH